MSRRLDKINELLKREIAKVLRELLPEDFITVNEVQISADLSSAKVWLRSIGDIDDVVKRSQACVSGIGKQLAPELKLRRFPRLHFMADKAPEKVERIEELIDEIHSKNG